MGVVCGLLIQARLRGIVRGEDVETSNELFWMTRPEDVRSVDLVGTLTEERRAEPLFLPSNKSGRLLLSPLGGAERAAYRAACVRNDVKRFCLLYDLPQQLVSPKSFRQGFACSVMRVVLDALPSRSTVSLQSIQAGCQASAQWRCVRQAMTYAR